MHEILETIMAYFMTFFIVAFGIASIWLSYQEDKEKKRNEQKDNID